MTTSGRNDSSIAITRSQAPTLVDVAREAGVSLKTASRVLNGSTQVSEEKVAKIRAVMERLGYRPNELARGLKARRSAAIGMVVPNLSDPFIASAIRAVQQVARANGYVVILTSSGGYEDVERSEVETLVRRQIDGLILAPANGRADTISDILPPALRVVTFDEPIRGANFDSVTVTNRRSARDATQHMLDHGLRRIVAIGARPHLQTCTHRVLGYSEALKRSGLTPRPCLVEHEEMLTAEWLSQEVFNSRGVEAIFTLNWVCTMLTLRGLQNLGKKVGRDVRLISFDDFDLADLLTPSLTVVQQPTMALGREAATLLFRRLREKPTATKKVVLPARLITRASCGCDAAARP